MGTEAGSRMKLTVAYPSVKRDDKIVTFKHGGQITDVYQWLENTDSPEVKEFVHSQNEITCSYLEKCRELKRIKLDLKQMCGHGRVTCPTENSETGSLFYFKNDETGSGGADSLYTQRGVKGKPEVLISANNIPGSSSKKCYIRMYSLLRDGTIIAYAVGGKESKWMTIRFKEISTGNDLPDVLTNVCMSDICWTLDGKGILYSCYGNEKTVNHQVCFHRIGTEQLEDLVLVAFPNRPTMTLQAQISDCGEFIFIYGQLNDPLQRMHFFYGDFSFTVDDDYTGTPLLFELIEGNGLEMQYIANLGNQIFFRTNNGAPNFKVVYINLGMYDRFAKHDWKTIVEEEPQKVLDWAVAVNKDYLMVCYVEHATHELELRNLRDGELIHRYSLPIGTITEYFGDRKCSRFYFTFSSFVTPDMVQYIEVSDSCQSCRRLNPWGVKSIKPFNKDLCKRFNTSGYVVKRLSCVNHGDKTKIPIIVIYKKGTKLNEQTPCVMYAQGCFGVQVMPSFSISKWAFLHYFRGVVAIVGVRGGGEYGEKWYQMGCGLHKKNTYEDFIVATEYLVKSGYTSHSKLILEGEGHGGNLAAVCLAQRPDLYAAVIIHDGLLDMMRFHLFPQSKDYLAEFGDPEADENFDNLRTTSPVHNIFVNTDHFPSVFAVMGGGRCLSHPSNSYKFVAQVQCYLATRDTCNNPCLLRPKPASKPGGDVSDLPDDVVCKIEERADIFAFLMQSMGLKLIEHK